MKTNLLKGVAIFGVAAALVASVPNVASAAPFKAGHGEALKNSAPSDTINVHRRWYRHGGFWAGAAVGGLVLGSALAAPYYYNRYDRPYYDGYYAYGGYPAGGYPGQRCWVQTGPYRGQGYWGWC